MKMSKLYARGKLFSLAIVAAGLTWTNRPATATVTYSDGNWGAAWSQGAQFLIGTVPGSSETALTVATGGNPAAYYQQRTTFSAAPAGTRNGIENAYLFSGAANYAPSLNPIQTIDFSIDVILLAGGGVADAGVVLQQGGNFYSTSVLTSPSAAWSPLSSTGLTAASFGLMASDPSGINPNGLVDFSQNPDFSVTGGLINFGFDSGHSTGIGGPGNSISEGFDNFNLVINTPEPTSLALLVIGGVARRDPPAVRQSHISRGPTVINITTQKLKSRLAFSFCVVVRREMMIMSFVFSLSPSSMIESRLCPVLLLICCRRKLRASLEGLRF